MTDWSTCRTFFPVFLSLVRANCRPRRALVVGSSQGKFVQPLLDAGFQVVANDLEPGARPDVGGIPGGIAGADARVARVVGDFRDVDCGLHPAVWTSCSWHYSLNFDRPVGVFIARLLASTAPGGLLGMEYFMPLSPRQIAQEHYLERGAISRYIPGDWETVFEAYTPPYTEQPHPGAQDPHSHRLGFLVTRKPLTSGNRPLSDLLYI